MKVAAPKDWVARLAAASSRTGFLRNALALGYGQVGRILIQFVSVPVFTYFWGLDGYGTWLLLFTLPSFIMMGDIGLNLAASNAMIAAIERGDTQKAADIFRALRLAVLTLASIILAAVLLVLLAQPRLVEFASAGTGGREAITVALFVGYSLIGLQNTSTLAGFRSAGDYARGVMLSEVTFQLESVAALAAVVAGGTLFHAALAFFGVRAAMAIYAALRLRWHAPQLFAKSRAKTRDVLRELVAPAIAVSALPVSHALCLQGTIAVLGAIAGPAAAAVFATTRMLVRLPFQLGMITVNAAMPLFTAAASRGDKARMDGLVRTTLAATAIVLIPASGLLALAGEWLVGLWTNGAIQPGFTVIALLILSTLLYGPWMVLCNFVIALNRQASFSYVYLLASLAMLALAAALASPFGATGAALAAVALDALMLAWIVRVSGKLGIVGRGTAADLLTSARLKQALALIKHKMNR